MDIQQYIKVRNDNSNNNSISLIKIERGHILYSRRLRDHSEKSQLSDHNWNLQMHFWALVTKTHSDSNNQSNLANLQINLSNPPYSSPQSPEDNI